MKLNEKITYCRKRAGLSQVDLADKLGVSRQAVSKWETGESNPDVTKIPLLAKEFGVSADWLLSEAEPAENAPEEPVTPAPSRDAYPDWVNKLPSHILRMVKKFGWLYGVRLAVSGLLITAVGCLARFMFRSMLFPGFSSGLDFSATGNLGGFSTGGFNPGFGISISGADPFSSFQSSTWQIFSVFTGFIIGLGVVLMLFGIVLAVVLKKWGNQDS